MCLKKAACSIDIIFNVVLCTMHLLNVVVFKLQVASNVNFIVVEHTNVCYLSSSTVLPLLYMYHWQVKATRTKP